MQDIENDMDDLFRRAAEEYPLNAGQADWESIEKSISVTSIPVEIARPEKKKNNKLFLLVLSLVIFSLAGLLISQQDLKKNAMGKPSDQLSHQSLQKNKSIENSKPIDNVAFGESEVANNIITKNETRTTPGNMLEERTEVNSGKLHDDNKRNIFPKKNASQFLADRDDSQQQTTIISDQKEEFSNQESIKQFPSIEHGSSLAEKEGDQKKQPSINKELASNKKGKTGAGKKNMNENGVYTGLLAGIDFSKVKSTPFKEPGFGGSILVGYKMKSIFLETGASLENKYYSSRGSSFNDADANMPTGMVIENLESRSKILEIPLKAGYYFYKKKRTKLFITGGTSVYIMTNEKNNYNVTMNGSPQKMTGLYEKNNLKIPAVASISAGWEYNLDGLYNLRIEPVLKLPLKGIGIGRLPVTSIGIQVGVTRKIK